MKQLAEGVYKLRGFPPNAINVYLADDVVIDAATRFAGRRILRQIAVHDVRAHALTHAHPDHQGASRELCVELDVPLWCGAGDADAMETGQIADAQPSALLNTLIDRFWTGPRYPVARRLAEGDDVAGFTVLETPGHSAGHVAYWREGDRTLILGDVLNNMDLRTSIPGLHEPPALFTPDPERNRESIRRIAALRPALALFGHGPPLRDPDKLERFAAALPG